MTFFPTSRFAELHKSVLVRVGLAMALLALLSFISVGISTVMADSSRGKATAINVSGSLRMMSFRLLSEVLQPDKRGEVAASITQFEKRLSLLVKFIEERSAPYEATTQAIQTIEQEWQRLRPLLRAAAGGNPRAVHTLAEDIPVFVHQVDYLVQLIEEDLELKMNLLRMTQFVLLCVMILVTLLTIWKMRQWLFKPLAELLKAAHIVSQGSFRVRVEHVKEDELGQLGRAFNAMVSEIAHMYAHLEDKVEEKTQALLRTNQSLELLYRTSQQLSASELTLETLQGVLRDIEKALDLGHSMICINENAAGSLAHPLLGDLSHEELRLLCAEQNCAECFARAHDPDVERGRKPLTAEHSVIFLPLEDAQAFRGAMPILLKKDEPLAREKLRLIETVGRHVATALSNMRRTEEKHRLAVLEERSVIARELHDSIAQSLSYLKIQVTRLERSLGEPATAQVIAEELKSGLNTAYRELRELITTFRLRIDERGFNVALQETVEEFSGKLGFAVGMHNAVVGIALSGNEEMHVIRIVRESLANIEKHAQARKAGIRITIDPICHQVGVSVVDDGVGFDPAAVPPNHYGLSIMRDRAQSLSGQLDVVSGIGGGTEVRLSFIPQKYRVAVSDKEKQSD